MIDKQIDRQTNRWIDRYTNRQTSKQIDRMKKTKGKSGKGEITTKTANIQNPLIFASHVTILV